jgi:hypothetical protein
VQTAQGTYFTTATSVTPDSSGNDQISISPQAPTGVGWQTITCVSLMPLSRLGSDKIVLKHDTLSTELDLMIRSTDQ